MRRHTRSGFTLIELLTVIAIIGLLVQMMLPAVQAAREAARRNTCSNQLRQIGLAAQAHISATGRFPTGGWHWNWVGDPDRGNGEKQPGGWIYNLLPYLEYQAIHDLGARQDPATKRRLAAQMQATAPALFNCPSRRDAMAYTALRSEDVSTPIVPGCRPAATTRPTAAICSCRPATVRQVTRMPSRRRTNGGT